MAVHDPFAPRPGFFARVGSWFADRRTPPEGWDDRPAPSVPAPPPETTPAPPVAADTTPNLRVPLPSQDELFTFQFVLAVRCLVDGRTAMALDDPLLIAKGAICQRIAPIARSMPITEAVRLRAEVEADLCKPQPVAGTPVVAWAHCLSIEVPEEWLAIVRRRQEALQEACVQAWRWQEQEQQIQFLAALMTDPRRATAWWLMRNEGSVDQLVDTARQFLTLRELLAESGDDLPDEGSMATLVERFWLEAAGPARELLGQHVAHLFDRHGRGDLAEQAKSLLAPGDAPGDGRHSG
jgi:hypothetical protein